MDPDRADQKPALSPVWTPSGRNLQYYLMDFCKGCVGSQPPDWVSFLKDQEGSFSHARPFLSQSISQFPFLPPNIFVTQHTRAPETEILSMRTKPPVLPACSRRPAQPAVKKLGTWRKSANLENDKPITVTIHRAVIPSAMFLPLTLNGRDPAGKTCVPPLPTPLCSNLSLIL